MSDGANRGIAAAGVHVPRFRLDTDANAEVWGVDHANGIDRKAVPAADEDAVTMGLAAAEDALDRGTAARDDLAFVGLATTTPPLAEEELSPHLVRALDAPADARTATETASPLAGLDVLDRALNADGPGLAVAADAPEGDPAGADHRMGAAAVAFLVTDNASVRYGGVTSHADEYPGVRYRERDSNRVKAIGVRSYERSAVRESLSSVIDALGIDPNGVAGAALHQPDGGFPYRVRGALPKTAIAHGTVVDRVGDAGAATVPLGLLAALTAVEPDETTLAVDFGGGGAALGIVFEGALDAVPDVDVLLDGGVDVSYERYLRERGYVVDTDVAGGGANVSLPSWRRSLDGRYRLTAGQCPDCGSLTFPAEGACGACHSRVDFEAVDLPRTGEVAAVTTIEQGGAPPEFIPQQTRNGSYAVAVVRFTNGDASVALPMQVTDCDPKTVSIGDTVHATIRRIYTDEGIPRYGAKATPPK